VDDLAEDGGERVEIEFVVERESTHGHTHNSS
jgi:hypothetical protein